MIQTHKPVHVQAFIPKPAVEAFNVGVIDRFPRTIEHQFHSVAMRLGIEGFADEFRPIIDRDYFRHPFEPGNSVQYVEHPNPTAVIQIVAHEVHCPALVPSFRFWRSHTARCSCFPSPFDPEHQVFFSIQPFSSLVIDLEALSPQQVMQAAIPPTLAFISKLTQSLPDRLIRIRFRLVMPTGSAETQEHTKLSQTLPEAFMQIPDGIALGFGRYHFFELISLSIWMSRA